MTTREAIEAMLKLAGIPEDKITEALAEVDE